MRVKSSAETAEVRAGFGSANAELKAEFAALRIELRAFELRLEVKIEVFKADLLSRIRSMLLGATIINVVAIVGAMFVVAKLLGH